MSEAKQSFWTTLPGILTGAAAVITACTGLWLAVPKGNENADNPRKMPSGNSQSNNMPSAAPVDINKQQRYVSLTAYAQPNTVGPGEKTYITVVARDGEGKPLPGAYVKVSAGGGKFLHKGETYDPKARLHGPYSASGVTDLGGEFTTEWVCNPCAASYTMAVEAEKKGFTLGKAKFSISIR